MLLHRSFPDVFLSVANGAGFVLVSRVMQYRQDWIRGAAIPTVLAAVMGVVTMLINRFLTPACRKGVWNDCLCSCWNSGICHSASCSKKYEGRRIEQQPFRKAFVKGGKTDPFLLNVEPV